MTRPTTSRHRHDRPPRPAWVVPAAYLGVATALVVLFQVFGPNTPPKRAAPAQPVSIAKTTSTPTPKPTAKPDLVADAMKIEPLEDIHKGDRVIYQRHVCTWQSWNTNINTSTIKCGRGKAFQIQTGRLTPVELKAGPSKLKTLH